jgi:hypothetical protein
VQQIFHGISNSDKYVEVRRAFEGTFESDDRESVVLKKVVDKLLQLSELSE